MPGVLAVAKPFDSGSDLPAEIQAVLPDAAQALFVRIFNNAFAASDSEGDEREAEAFATAYSGLSNAGWAPGEDGVWMKVEKRLRVSIAKRKGSDVSDINLRVEFEIAKRGGADAPLRVFGWASMALTADGSLIIDHQDDIIEVPELELAAAAFVKRGGKANVNHEGPAVGHVIQSVVMTPQMRVAMGLDGTGPTGWWLGFEITDPDAIAKVRSGELREFSIEGTARRVPKGDAFVLKNLDIPFVALVDAGAGLGVTIERFKRNQMTKKVKKQDEADSLPVPEETEKQALTSALELLGALSADEMLELMEALKAAMSEADEVEAQLDEPEETMKRQIAKAAQAEIAKARKEAAEARAEVAKLRDEQTRREYVEKAKSFGMLPSPDTTVEELGGILRALDENLTPEQAEKARGIFKAADALARNSAAFEAMGSRRSGNAEANSAQAEMEARALKYQESQPEWSLAKCRTQVQKNDPALAKRLRDEQIERSKGGTR